MASLKRIIKKAPAFIYLESLFRRLRYRNRSDELVFIHIGKCGGGTLWDAINRSAVLKRNFAHIWKVHVEKPPILTRSRYLIVVRNPVDCALSAFNWRYRLVVDDGRQKRRFKGEYDILNKYGTLNALAEALYDGSVLDAEVASELGSIHHIRQSISFYLTDLLKAVSSDQVLAVFSTEYLDEDIEKYLSVETGDRVHENASKYDDAKLHLSEIAKDNLRRYLREDYEAIEMLLSLYPVPSERREALLS